MTVRQGNQNPYISSNAGASAATRRPVALQQHQPQHALNFEKCESSLPMAIRSPLFHQYHDEHNSSFAYPSDQDSDDDFPCQQLQVPPQIEWIDNSALVYEPLQLRCGVWVRCRPEVLTTCPLILRDLDDDVGQCLTILPRSVHDLVRRTTIWINHTFVCGPRHSTRHHSPIVLRHSTAHHHQAWLLSAHDRPDKALGIEIYNAEDFRRMRWHWNGCGLILHEFIHLIHQQVLPQGLDNPRVRELYQRAVTWSRPMEQNPAPSVSQPWSSSPTSGGLYEHCLRRDWAGKAMEHDLHYGLVDHKEFFAEMSVTYLAEGYRYLDRRRPTCVLECSPPIMEPNVLTRLFPPTASPQQAFPSFTNPAAFQYAQNHYQAGQKCRTRRSRSLEHCNKFFPFTRGQLRVYDPALFRALDQLWIQIENWHDPRAQGCSGCGGSFSNTTSAASNPWQCCWWYPLPRAKLSPII